MKKNYSLEVIHPADLMDSNEMSKIVGGGTCIIKVGFFCLPNNVNTDKGGDKPVNTPQPQPAPSDSTTVQKPDSTTVKS